MRRLALTLVGALAALALAGACSEASAPTISPGDDLVDDTNNEDTGPPMPAPPPDTDAEMDAGLYPDGSSSYMPMLGQCAACACTASKGFCFAGGIHFSGAPDAGEPACSMVGGPDATVNGCNALPAACAATPTCGCVLEAIQPQFKCYLVCTPDDGYLLVYCPNGT
jgi:hypothetical protein